MNIKIVARSSGRTRMALASGSGSASLPTSFEGKEHDLKQLLVALYYVPSDGFLAEVSGFLLSVRQMPGNTVCCTASDVPAFHHHSHHLPFSD